MAVKNYGLAAQAPHLALHAPHFALHAPQPALHAPHLAFAACRLLAVHLDLALQIAAHAALQAPHLLILCLGPHWTAEQPAAMALPVRAVAVTTAEASILVICAERFIIKSLDGLAVCL